MRAATALVIAVLLCMAGGLSSANDLPQAAPQPTGYCGSGATDSLVPEGMFGCTFTEACRAHDVCYGKCDPGGALHGSEYCGLGELSPQRIAARRSCDNRLREDIIRLNANRPLCRKMAGVYRGAVVLAGQGPFNGREVSLETLRRIVEHSPTPEHAEALYTTIVQLTQEGRMSADAITWDQGRMRIDLLDAPRPSRYVRDGDLVIPKRFKVSELEKLRAAE